MAATYPEVQSVINQNVQTLDILSAEELVAAHSQRHSPGNIDLSSKIKTIAALGPTLLDLQKAQRIIRELGITGKVKLVTKGSKQYVIFKGDPRARSIITGTRYLDSNAKVVDMAIGRKGVNKVITSGARISVYFTVPINVLTHILNDNQTRAEFLSSVATDVGKTALVAAIVTVAGSATAAVTTLAAGPVVMVIAAGVGATIGLDALDKRFGITQALANELQEAYDDTVGEIKRQASEANRKLKWQVQNGKPIGQGIFY